MCKVALRKMMIDSTIRTVGDLSSKLWSEMVRTSCRQRYVHKSNDSALEDHRESWKRHDDFSQCLWDEMGYSNHLTGGFISSGKRLHKYGQIHHFSRKTH